jgi:hypothetical protein
LARNLPITYENIRKSYTSSEVTRRVKKFYYIALKGGESCEGICRCESIDEARKQLEEDGMEEINIAILRSDNMDFIDLENSAQGIA